MLVTVEDRVFKSKLLWLTLNCCNIM